MYVRSMYGIMTYMINRLGWEQGFPPHLTRFCVIREWRATA